MEQLKSVVRCRKPLTVQFSVAIIEMDILHYLMHLNPYCSNVEMDSTSLLFLLYFLHCRAQIDTIFMLFYVTFS